MGRISLCEKNLGLRELQGFILGKAVHLRGEALVPGQLPYFHFILYVLCEVMKWGRNQVASTRFAGVVSLWCLCFCRVATLT